MRRRSLLGAIACAFPATAMPAIVKPSAASAKVRHRLSDAQRFALVGRRLGDAAADFALRADFARLLGSRHRDFVARLAEQSPMRRIGQVVIGEGTRPDTLGHDASLFLLGPRGAMFVVIKGGRFGTDIAEFGDVGLLADWDVRHRYLEFTDLDE